MTHTVAQHELSPSQKREWSSRIPAAIAKAESLTNGHDHRVALEEGSLTIITATEVALAKALWELWVEYCDALDWEEAGDTPPPALIVFAQKVESL